MSFWKSLGFLGAWGISSWAISDEALLWKWSVIRELAPEEFATQELCREVDAKYKKLGWGSSSCSQFSWKIFGWSHQNRPLIYWERGRDPAEKLTVIQCGIHGDEVSSVPMCLEMGLESLEGKRELPKESTLVIQPLLNPDGFLASPSTRTNARGVDINRNFPTQEWEKEAQPYWISRDRKDPRKFPGSTAASEPETIAIVDFIQSRKPQKIVSIHSPLGFLELDSRGDEVRERRAQFLAINMVKNTKDLDFKSFGVWPGSLGNFAGRHGGIPVYTMELPPGHSRRHAQKNWAAYGFSLWRALQFDLETGSFHED